MSQDTIRTKPASIYPLTDREVSRFWARVDKTPGHGPQGDCWIWKQDGTGAKYGRMTIYRKGRKRVGMAPRLSYYINNGPFHENLLILHKCDVPRCVNPDHLVAGTNEMNSQDMGAKGRQHRQVKAALRGENRIRLRIADIAIAKGIGICELQQSCGDWSHIIYRMWYNQAPTISLVALGRVAERLGVHPGELLEPL